MASCRALRGHSPSSTDSTITLGSCHAALIDEDDPRRATFLNREDPCHGHKVPLGLLNPQETTVCWAESSEDGHHKASACSFSPGAPRPDNSEARPIKLRNKRQPPSEPDSDHPTKRPRRQEEDGSIAQKLAEHAAGYDADHDSDVNEYLSSQTLRSRVTAAGPLGLPVYTRTHWNRIEPAIEDVLQVVDEKIFGVEGPRLPVGWRSGSNVSGGPRVWSEMRVRKKNKGAKGPKGKGKERAGSEGSGSK